MIVFGVDPGFAHLGASILEWDPLKPTTLPKVLDLAVFATNKSKRAGKVCQDDIERMRILWRGLRDMADEFSPVAIGVETYTVFDNAQNRGKGVGWKAGWLYSITAAIGFELSLDVLPFAPADLKRRIGQDKGASKLDVEQRLYPLLDNLQPMLSRIPENSHEHAADAAGHGLLALHDYCKANGYNLPKLC